MAKSIQEAMKQQAGAPEAAKPQVQQVVEPKPQEVKAKKVYNPHARFVAACPMVNLGD